MKKLITVIILCLLCSPLIFSQTSGESGYPLITNYSPKDYGAFQANWAIAQDKRGIMYFGNDFGLLEFDGTNWRFYTMPNKTTVRSIAIGNNGKMYVGAVGDLGYFAADSSGRFVFHSLMKFLPNDKRDFSDVWTTLINNNKVYFNVAKYILVWDIQKKKFNVLQGKDNFHLMFLVDGKIYAREWGKGLEVLKNNKLTLLKGGEKFANERIYVMLPFPGEPGTILIGTRTMGLFKYDGESFIPFKTEADEFLKNNLIYWPGTILSDGNILLGTINGGALVINSSGNLIRKYNRKNGIISSGILYTFQDKAGAIWLGTDNGISRIDYSSPVSYFDSRNNFSTAATDIIRYNGTIYADANNGVYYLDPHTSDLLKLKNSDNQSWTFLNFKGELLVATFDGLFEIVNDKLIPIRKTVGNEYNAFALKQSKLNPNRIYVGAQGLWSIQKTRDGWKDEGQIVSMTDNVSSIIEDNDGTIWVGTNISGAYKIKFKKDAEGNIILKNPDVEHFAQKSGLSNGYLVINNLNGTNYFATSDSIFKFNESSNRFYSDTSDNIISYFYKQTNNNSAVFFQQDSLGRLWLGTLTTLAMGTRRADGTYKWTTSPFRRIVGEQISKVYAEKNGITWFLAGSGIIRYDFSKKESNNISYPAMVRKVYVGKDSTIYFGGVISNFTIPEISFKDNSLKFNYSATTYESKNTTRFKTLLEGFDDGWSGWSNENTKEYTNLPPGKYTFNVIAENILGVESSPGTYSFEILPPWYRTWWAYLCYAAILGFAIYGFDRFQRRRLTLKERQRTHLREMELRTEAAESEAKALQAENDRKKNVELLSEIGKEITATLDLDTIFYKLYEHVNQLADASIFGVGIYHPENEEIEYRLAIEKGKRYPVYTRDTKDKNQFPVWCIENKKPVFINDVASEYNKYIQIYKEPDRKLEDGTKAEEPSSIIYLPLVTQDRILGVITIQSFQKNAYTDYHLNILQNLASYTSIALDNADAYEQLNETVNKLNATLNDLKSTQEKLVVQEKLASLGALTAGIAHEIKNPLNFINNFSDVSNELLDELIDELKKGDKEEIAEIIKSLKQNLDKITNHGKRADSIVKGMLLHSRGTAGEKALTDINDLLDQYAALAYHGLRAQDKEFNISFEKDYDKTIDKINVVPQDISRVFLNIINNACYAANDKKKKAGNGFVPLLKISTKNLNDKVEVHIKDNGMGIPDKIKSELFNPFFTTKPSGEGTGLGLSLSYDIVVKQHGGEIKVESKEGEGAEFIIIIPKL
jgi:signal transduction histidine kinase/ligand-binding sensor domain-containing protein